jgi:low temperature requirement protein LtrA
MAGPPDVVSERLLTSVLPAGNKRKGWVVATARHTRPVSIVPVPLRRPVVARDSGQHDRASTPLELLFDLVFVVAIASNAAQLHHGLSEAHYGTIVGYSMTWFAIWWAWMNYSWFASAYDNDDVVFRLLTFVIMVGALFLAAGVPDIFEDGQSTTVVVGYAIMRFAMVGLWLRAAAGHPERRQTALWYAGGITVVQVLWIARLWVPESWWVPSFFLLVAMELCVPLLAEVRHGYTPFHPHHIAERYGLLTIIVLGEVILSSVQAIQGVMTGEGEGLTWAMAPVIAGGLLIVFSLWWAYFARENAGILDNPRAVWVFGYGHLPVFASVAAVGAALAAAVDVVEGEAVAGPQPVALVLAVAVSVVWLTISGLHAMSDRETVATMVPAAVVTIVCLGVALLAPSMGAAVLLIGLTLATVVAVRVVAVARTAEGVR